MLAIGDIHLYVGDFDAALRFWASGLQLEVAEREASEHGSFARLEFPDGGPALVIIAPAEPLSAAPAGDAEARPGFSLELHTTDFEATLARLLENEGQQLGETESYNDLRIATLVDPEGNVFELLELPEEEAKSE